MTLKDLFNVLLYSVENRNNYCYYCNAVFLGKTAVIMKFFPVFVVHLVRLQVSHKILYINMLKLAKKKLKHMHYITLD